MKRVIPLAVLALLLAVLPAPALAAPDNSHTLPVTLTCSGGTQLVQTTLNGGYLYHAVGTNSTYVIKYIASPETGVVRDVRGFGQNGLPTLTCTYIGPSSGNHYTVVVMQTPVG